MGLTPDEIGRLFDPGVRPRTTLALDLALSRARLDAAAEELIALAEGAHPERKE